MITIPGTGGVDVFNSVSSMKNKIRLAVIRIFASGRTFDAFSNYDTTLAQTRQLFYRRFCRFGPREREGLAFGHNQMVNVGENIADIVAY